MDVPGKAFREMAKQRMKARHREEVRALMIAASREIVLAEGIDALTIRRVAKAIGYCGGSIYSYFDSREAIAIELVREGFERLNDYMKPAHAVADPIERLYALGNAYLRFAEEESPSFRLIFMNQAKLSDQIMAEALERHGGFNTYEFLVDAVRKVLELRNITAIDANEIAQLCWCTAHGVATLRLTLTAFPFSEAQTLMNHSMSAMLCRIGLEPPLAPPAYDAHDALLPGHVRA
jgi:AcrR family transcriptional regulator